jgi:hypothetical protein
MSLGNVLGAAAPIAAGYFGGPAMAGFTGGATSGAIAAGALTGAGIAALTGQDLLMGSITGGLGGMGGGGISGAMDAATKAKLATVTPGATTAGINTGLQNVASANLAQAGLPQNLGMMSSPSALGAYQPITGLQGAVAPNMGFVNKPPVGPGVGMTAKQATSGLPSGGGYTFKDFERAALPTGSTDIGINDIAGQLGKNAETGELNPALGYGKMALTASAPVMAAFEPEVVTDEQMKASQSYDPNRRLSLNMDTGIGAALNRDTGLRLIKEGGHIKGYKGGGGLGLKSLINSGNTQGSAIDKATIDPLARSSTNAFTGAVIESDLSGQSILDMLRSKGIIKYENGGYLETGGRVGDGMSDDIKATINNEQEARLSDGEFVVPADVVSHLGNGSSDAGAKRLYDMMDKIRQARTGTIKQGREINPERYMPA